MLSTESGNLVFTLIAVGFPLVGAQSACGVLLHIPKDVDGDFGIRNVVSRNPFDLRRNSILHD